MTDTEWTPGPWVVGWKTAGNNLPGHTSISGAIGKPREHLAMAQVVTELDGEAYTEGEANAFLISAAPDMAEALEKLIGWEDTIRTYIPNGGLTSALTAARAALAKARGEA